MIEEYPTYTRDKTKLLKIKTKAALEEEVAMEEATDNDGVITFWMVLPLAITNCK